MRHHESHAGPSNSGTSRFRVQTTDVLQDMRVNVSEEGSEKVIWYKERFLEDQEIIENVVHTASNKICWSIHRPLRGWSIRIRSPMFPPGVFIPLTPVPSSAPYHTDAALSFNSRTNIPVTSNPADEVQFTLQDEQVASSSSSVHSYPPTPTAAVNVIPPTPNNCPGPSSPPLRRPLRPPPMVSSQITQFVLSPSSIQPAQQLANTSFLARAFSALKSQQPSHSNSFTLSRHLANNQQSPPPPYASRISVVTEAAQSTTAILPEQPQQPLLHTPLLVFHDQTPVLTVRSLTGLIELDQAEEMLLGVETSFWIAVALTYLEFLEERESYLAALGD